MNNTFYGQSTWKTKNGRSGWEGTGESKLVRRGPHGPALITHTKPLNFVPMIGARVSSFDGLHGRK